LALRVFRRGERDRAGLHAALRPVQDGFERLLDDGLTCAAAGAVGFCQALDRRWPALWTFADEEGVEPADNAGAGAAPGGAVAQGLLRHQSDTGAQFVERLLTVVATCKQQGRDVPAHLADASPTPAPPSCTAAPLHHSSRLRRSCRVHPP
jgi:transposase